MLPLDNLAGIETEKRTAAKTMLDSLLTFNICGELRPVITGYSWFDELAASDRVVTFSHSHETENYKQAMLRDLSDAGFSSLSDKIRNKGSAYLWKPQFRHRDDSGRVLPGKAIRDVKTGEQIDLTKYSLSLSRYPKFRNKFGRLVCEDCLEWQIDIPFKTKTELLQLSAIFLSGAYSRWPAPHDLPLVIMGSAAQKYTGDRRISSNFGPATLFYLEENGNEINTIVGKSVRRLDYAQLRKFGFKKEPCLVNMRFKEYLDSI